MFRPSIPSILLLSASFLLTSPAYAKEKYQRIVPPANVIPGIRKVVIVDHTGGWGDTFNKQAADAVRSNQLSFQPGIPAADEPMKSGIIDFVIVPGQETMGGEQLVALAAEHNAQAVLIASAGGEQTAYETFNEDRKGYKTVNEQRVEETWTVGCARRDVEANWKAVLYNGADGSMVTSSSGSSTDSDKDCDERGDDPLKVKDADDMIAGIVTSGAVKFTFAYAPYWDTVAIEVPRDRAAKDAIAVADDGDWVTAIEMAQELLLDDPYNAPAVYLTGLALELHGRAADGANLYKFASRLKDDNVYDKAVTRARQRAGELTTLGEAFGLVPTAGNFTGVDALLQRAATAAAVAVVGSPASIKGAKNKRVPVTAAADASSEILASVPGGTEVRRIKAEGGRVEVQLPDGVQGWVDEKMVK